MIEVLLLIMQGIAIVFVVIVAIALFLVISIMTICFVVGVAGSLRLRR